MSQTRRAIEQLIEQHKLPLKHAEAAAKHLEVYPSKSTWLSFFDKALLIIGALALVLSLGIFIAYNWRKFGYARQIRFGRGRSGYHYCALRGSLFSAQVSFYSPAIIAGR